VARSLGEPPLLPPAAAEYQLQVVYEEAVKAAVGLAAANGLLADAGADADIGAEPGEDSAAGATP
jgi:hypothetical protein